MVTGGGAGRGTAPVVTGGRAAATGGRGGVAGSGAGDAGDGVGLMVVGALAIGGLSTIGSVTLLLMAGHVMTTTPAITTAATAPPSAVIRAESDLFCAADGVAAGASTGGGIASGVGAGGIGAGGVGTGGTLARAAGAAAAGVGRAIVGGAGAACGGCGCGGAATLNGGGEYATGDGIATIVAAAVSSCCAGAGAGGSARAAASSGVILMRTVSAVALVPRAAGFGVGARRANVPSTTLATFGIASATCVLTASASTATAPRNNESSA